MTICFRRLAVALSWHLWLFAAGELQRLNIVASGVGDFHTSPTSLITTTGEWSGFSELQGTQAFCQ
jgi:hypothetical protein